MNDSNGREQRPNETLVNGQTLTDYGFKKVDGKYTKLYSPKSLPPRRIVVKPAEWNVDAEGKHEYWRVEIDGVFIANINTTEKLQTTILVFTDFEQRTFAH